ncbi:MAG: GGDEF domain-containing protein [Sciscionella sp.]
MARASMNPTRWAIWNAAVSVRAYYLGVELTALVVLAICISGTANAADWGRFVLLTLLAVVETELSNRVERTRRHLTDVLHIDLTSVWVLPAALVLPVQLTVVMIAVVYAHLWARIWRATGVRKPHRVFFGATTVVIGSVAAHEVTAVLTAGPPAMAPLGWLSILGLLLGSLAAFGLNLVLIMGALKIRQTGRPIGELFGTWRENALEIATLCLGIFTAIVLVNAAVLAILMLVPVLVLHRGVLMQQLRDMATTEPKTGLLNSSTWNDHLERELSRAQRQGGSFGVLMMDLDHFKNVNDQHGHFAGDEVLKAIATVLKTETRIYDSAGRFGGEEFVVLMPDMTAVHVVAAAERIRSRIAELAIPLEHCGGGAALVEGAGNDHEVVIAGLSTSIGVAVYPQSGRTLTQVLQAADAAVYLAKRQGRNRVVYREAPAPQG